MNTLLKSVTACGIAALSLCALVAPASAQAGPHVRHAQVRKAASLDRKAAHAASMGHFKAAHRMATKAAHLRSAAHHGY